MGAVRVGRLTVAAAIASVTACSIWAAIDDPYKNDEAPVAGGRDASVDAPSEGGTIEAGAGAVTHVLDAGFVPYAIAAVGDTVYVADNRARVHVAADAGTAFTTFWVGDGGDTFLPTNRIAASASRVCWTLTSSVRCCGTDGGACERLASPSAPTAVAASDTAVAWIDTSGVRVCTTPLATCDPSTLPASKGAQSVAAGPNGDVAWTSGDKVIHVANGQGTSTIPFQFQVSLVATEGSSDTLYFEGQYAVGFVHFDGKPGANTGISSGYKPSQLFAARGLVYWSLAGGTPPTDISYCRLDATTSCAPRGLASGVLGRTTNFGIVATSRDVFSVISSLDDTFPSELVTWRVP